MKFKALVILAMVAAMAGSVSAARNFIVNGSFEVPFASTNSAGVTNGVYNGDPGEFAYGAVDGLGALTIPSQVPRLIRFSVVSSCSKGLCKNL